MKKVLLCLLAVMLSTAVLVAQPKKGNFAEIKFDNTSFDFGSVKQGTPVVVDFKFVNIGKEPLVISDVTPNSGGVSPKYPRWPISPGKWEIIKLTLQTNGNSFRIIRSVTVKSNSIKGLVVLTVTGNVEAANREP